MSMKGEITNSLDSSPQLWFWHLAQNSFYWAISGQKQTYGFWPYVGWLQNQCGDAFCLFFIFFNLKKKFFLVIFFFQPVKYVLYMCFRNFPYTKHDG